MTFRPSRSATVPWFRPFQRLTPPWYFPSSHRVFVSVDWCLAKPLTRMSSPASSTARFFFACLVASSRFRAGSSGLALTPLPRLLFAFLMSSLALRRAAWSRFASALIAASPAFVTASPIFAMDALTSGSPCPMPPVNPLTTQPAIPLKTFDGDAMPRADFADLTADSARLRAASATHEIPFLMPCTKPRTRSEPADTSREPSPASAAAALPGSSRTSVTAAATPVRTAPFAASHADTTLALIADPSVTSAPAALAGSCRMKPTTALMPAVTADLIADQADDTVALMADQAAEKIALTDANADDTVDLIDANAFAKMPLILAHAAVTIPPIAEKLPVKIECRIRNAAATIVLIVFQAVENSVAQILSGAEMIGRISASEPLMTAVNVAHPACAPDTMPDHSPEKNPVTAAHAPVIVETVEVHAPDTQDAAACTPPVIADQAAIAPADSTVHADDSHDTNLAHTWRPVSVCVKNHTSPAASAAMAATASPIGFADIALLSSHWAALAMRAYVLNPASATLAPTNAAASMPTRVRLASSGPTSSASCTTTGRSAATAAPRAPASATPNSTARPATTGRAGLRAAKTCPNASASCGSTG